MSPPAPATRRRPPGRPRIGCAGWSIASGQQALFGPGESMLARYATRFDAVEINSSFYRPHQRKTYERWAASVPAGFWFSVKLPKAITHENALRASAPLLDEFAGQVGGLGRKLGSVLVQLPPSLAFDARVAAAFFGNLRRRFDGGLCCEPRHASWFGEAAEAMLARHDIARVAADPAPHPGAETPAGGGKWRYWRLHGSPRMYYSAYDDAALATIAAQVRATARGTTPWVMFDNTAHSHATRDAARLQALLGTTPEGLADA